LKLFNDFMCLKDMAMYSNEDIENALNTGELVVEPYDPRLLKPSGLCLRLGAHILKPRSGTVVDPKNCKTPEFEEITITDDRPYELRPHEFVLGHTFERVTVGSKLGFLIEGRSTLARVGLTIVQTAMMVNPGHHNRCVTLELANHGPNSILLYPRLRIARVVVIELKSPSTKSYDVNGKYREQEVVGRPIFNDDEIF
jgi:dCTP deaminase